MANEIFKEIKTRLALRTGDYAYWTTGAGKDIELLKGEVCVCYLSAQPSGETVTTAPTVLFKVCHETGKKFADLDWMSAKAADVYSWAKKSEAEFTAWAKGLVPVEVTDDGTGKFVTGVNVTNDANGHHVTITRSNVAVADIAYFAEKVAEVKVAEAANADHAETATKAQSADAATRAGSAGRADAAAKVDNGLTIKVGGKDVVFDGSAAATADVDTAISDSVSAAKTSLENDLVTLESELATLADNVSKTYETKSDATSKYNELKGYIDQKPHENTAHSHSAGAGLSVIGEGGITGDVKYALNVAFELVDKTIKLYDKNDSTKTALATLDATEFIADGMLASVTADQANNKLVFEWNTDAGVTKTEIDLDKIADIYTGSTGAEVNVAVSNENVISASLNTEVATKIGHGETAYNWGNHSEAGYLKAADIANKADKVTGATNGNFAGLDANGNLTDSGKKASDFATKAQGDKADSAVQTVVSGTANGTIAVDGKDVAVTGLGTAAYENVSAFDAAGSAATAESNAKKYADDNFLKEVEVGTGLTVTTKANNKQVIDFDDNVVFVFNCGDSSVLI